MILSDTLYFYVTVYIGWDDHCLLGAFIFDCNKHQRIMVMGVASKISNTKNNRSYSY